MLVDKIIAKCVDKSVLGMVLVPSFIYREWLIFPCRVPVLAGVDLGWIYYAHPAAILTWSIVSCKRDGYVRWIPWISQCIMLAF